MERFKQHKKNYRVFKGNCLRLFKVATTYMMLANPHLNKFEWMTKNYWTLSMERTE